MIDCICVKKTKQKQSVVFMSELIEDLHYILL